MTVNSYDIHLQGKSLKLTVQRMPLSDEIKDNHAVILERCRKYLNMTEPYFRGEQFTIKEIKQRGEKLGL